MQTVHNSSNFFLLALLAHYVYLHFEICFTALPAIGWLPANNQSAGCSQAVQRVMLLLHPQTTEDCRHSHVASVQCFGVSSSTTAPTWPAFAGRAVDGDCWVSGEADMFVACQVVICRLYANHHAEVQRRRHGTTHHQTGERVIQHRRISVIAEARSSHSLVKEAWTWSDTSWSHHSRFWPLWFCCHLATVLYLWQTAVRRRRCQTVCVSQLHVWCATGQCALSTVVHHVQLTSGQRGCSSQSALSSICRRYTAVHGRSTGRWRVFRASVDVCRRCRSLVPRKRAAS